MLFSDYLKKKYLSFSEIETPSLPSGEVITVIAQDVVPAPKDYPCYLDYSSACQLSDHPVLAYQEWLDEKRW